MATKSKFFEVYINSSKPEFENTVIIKQGFNFYAFIFTALWALYNRLWFLFFGLIAIEGIIYNYASNNPDSDAIQFASILINIWLGFEAPNFKAKKLLSNGYELADVVCAIDDIEAERRFYDKAVSY